MSVEDAENKATAAAKKARAAQREREITDFRRVMDTPHGRRFVWRLMQGVFHDCSSDNALEMARFLGERRRALLLLNEVREVCPEQWVVMMQESKA